MGQIKDNNNSSPRNDANIIHAPKDADMTKQDRRNLLLQFLAEYDLALPPLAIYRNMRLKWNITFSKQSIHNYLDEFTDEGLVLRVEPAPIGSRKLVEAKGEDTRAYYIISEKGRDAARDLN